MMSFFKKLSFVRKPKNVEPRGQHGGEFSLRHKSNGSECNLKLSASSLNSDVSSGLITDSDISLGSKDRMTDIIASNVELSEQVKFLIKDRDSMRTALDHTNDRLWRIEKQLNANAVAERQNKPATSEVSILEQIQRQLSDLAIGQAKIADSVKRLEDDRDVALVQSKRVEEKLNAVLLTVEQLEGKYDTLAKFVNYTPTDQSVKINDQVEKEFVPSVGGHVESCQMHDDTDGATSVPLVQRNADTKHKDDLTVGMTHMACEKDCLVAIEIDELETVINSNLNGGHVTLSHGCVLYESNILSKVELRSPTQNKDLLDLNHITESYVDPCVSECLVSPTASGQFEIDNKVVDLKCDYQHPAPHKPVVVENTGSNLTVKDVNLTALAISFDSSKISKVDPDPYTDVGYSCKEAHLKLHQSVRKENVIIPPVPPDKRMMIKWEPSPLDLIELCTVIADSNYSDLQPDADGSDQQFDRGKIGKPSFTLGGRELSLVDGNENDEHSEHCSFRPMPSDFLLKEESSLNTKPMITVYGGQVDNSLLTSSNKPVAYEMCQREVVLTDPGPVEPTKLSHMSNPEVIQSLLLDTVNKQLEIHDLNLDMTDPTMPVIVAMSESQDLSTTQSGSDSISIADTGGNHSSSSYMIDTHSNCVKHQYLMSPDIRENDNVTDSPNLTDDKLNGDGDQRSSLSPETSTDPGGGECYDVVRASLINNPVVDSFLQDEPCTTKLRERIGQDRYSSPIWSGTDNKYMSDECTEWSISTLSCSWDSDPSVETESNENHSSDTLTKANVNEDLTVHEISSESAAVISVDMIHVEPCISVLPMSHPAEEAIVNPMDPASQPLNQSLHNPHWEPGDYSQEKSDDSIQVNLSDDSIQVNLLDDSSQHPTGDEQIPNHGVFSAVCKGLSSTPKVGRLDKLDGPRAPYPWPPILMEVGCYHLTPIETTNRQYDATVQSKKESRLHCKSSHLQRRRLNFASHVVQSRTIVQQLKVTTRAENMIGPTPQWDGSSSFFQVLQATLENTSLLALVDIGDLQNQSNIQPAEIACQSSPEEWQMHFGLPLLKLIGVPTPIENMVTTQVTDSLPSDSRQDIDLVAVRFTDQEQIRVTLPQKSAIWSEKMDPHIEQRTVQNDSVDESYSSPGILNPSYLSLLPWHQGALVPWDLSDPSWKRPEGGLSVDIGNPNIKTVENKPTEETDSVSNNTGQNGDTNISKSIDQEQIAEIITQKDELCSGTSDPSSEMESVNSSMLTRSFQNSLRARASHELISTKIGGNEEKPKQASASSVSPQLTRPADRKSEMASKIENRNGNQVIDPRVKPQADPPTPMQAEVGVVDPIEQRFMKMLREQFKSISEEAEQDRESAKQNRESAKRSIDQLTRVISDNSNRSESANQSMVSTGARAIRDNTSRTNVEMSPNSITPERSTSDTRLRNKETEVIDPIEQRLMKLMMQGFQVMNDEATRASESADKRSDERFNQILKTINDKSVRSENVNQSTVTQTIRDNTSPSNMVKSPNLSVSEQSTSEARLLDRETRTKNLIENLFKGLTEERERTLKLRERRDRMLKNTSMQPWEIDRLLSPKLGDTPVRPQTSLSKQTSLFSTV